ncbi:unnamed protein product [Effrenium voratum]|nr:unnamed protein product [Effrenium voratum]
MQWSKYPHENEVLLDPFQAFKVLKVETGEWLLCGNYFRQQLQREASLRPKVLVKPIVGLQNEGNTCYLNAILQCLVHTPLLYQSLCELPSQYLKKEDGRRWLAEFRQLYEGMCEAEDRGRPATSSNIAELITANKEFSRGQQADAHEAFMFIISRLLDACLVVGDGNGASPAGASYAVRESLERSSLIGHVFGMDLGQRVRCKSCSYSSIKSQVEYCLCLSCSLGSDEPVRPGLGSYGSYGSYSSYGSNGTYGRYSTNRYESEPSPTTLQEVLHAYARVEEIEGYECEKCHRRIGCKRSAHIKNKPNVLVVYIDRRQDSSRFGKINRFVEFPERLELSSLLEAPRGGYQLYGVVVHKDVNRSTFFGHYIAYVKTAANRWYVMDDASVYPVPWATVQEQRASLLFYAADKVELPPAEPKRTPSPEAARLPAKDERHLERPIRDATTVYSMPLPVRSPGQVVSRQVVGSRSSPCRTLQISASLPGPRVFHPEEGVRNLPLSGTSTAAETGERSLKPGLLGTRSLEILHSGKTCAKCQVYAYQAPFSPFVLYQDGEELFVVPAGWAVLRTKGGLLLWLELGEEAPLLEALKAAQVPTQSVSPPREGRQRQTSPASREAKARKSSPARPMPIALTLQLPNGRQLSARGRGGCSIGSSVRVPLEDAVVLHPRGGDGLGLRATLALLNEGAKQSVDAALKAWLSTA